MAEVSEKIKQIELIRKYGSYSLDLCYADERLKKFGVVPYDTQRGTDTTQGMFIEATKQANELNKPVAVYLNSGEIKGLFMVEKGHSSDTETLNMNYDKLVANQHEQRWDKDIETQKQIETKSGKRRFGQFVKQKRDTFRQKIIEVAAAFKQKGSYQGK